MGALFLHLKPDEYLKKLYKTKKLVEKTSFSLQAERPESRFFFMQKPANKGVFSGKSQNEKKKL
ncbi:hypothetical protein [Bacillus subtilis]|uniref:hypothetical protein n=1 Tax=Bacillus subtilis TaxID=1423 RepID=UPI00216580F1|nr:hypothetical protein [Bacillus subtilis]MEC0367997.1 hypothetical protein [Bacillus subtilis]MEC0400742.1 hypothetical protein [Bacillus subtilis]MEC0430274.1 hypothetical protein [Bacillus subtilis]UVW12444.1 hypothetical protein NX823_15165 [Bacillus subtilis]WRS94385.1 hypothetical protein VDS57_03010 [Bacillus subtilis]